MYCGLLLLILIVVSVQFTFILQGLLAQKRSNFQGNQFPLAREVARKAAAAPIRNGPFSQNRVANQNKRRWVRSISW